MQLQYGFLFFHRVLFSFNLQHENNIILYFCIYVEVFKQTTSDADVTSDIILLYLDINI